MANIELNKARTEDGKTVWIVIQTETDTQTEKVLFASPDREKAYVEYLYLSLGGENRNSHPAFARAAGA
jgi:hypothetical protein